MNKSKCTDMNKKSMGKKSTDMKPIKLAAGGVAKIRLEQSNESGKQKNTK